MERYWKRKKFKNKKEFEYYLKELGVKEVLFNPQEISINNNQFWLCHKPENYNSNMMTLFGHVHKLQLIKRFGLNIGVDCHNYTPISLDEILFYKNAMKNHYDHNVFMQQ
jgi:calcineurin-like phosphoesterase family protein